METERLVKRAPRERSKSLRERELGVVDVEVPRAALIGVLRARAKRLTYCRSLPVSMLFYGIFVALMCIKASVPNTFSFESPLQRELVTDTLFTNNVGGSVVVDRPTAYAWLAAVLPRFASRLCLGGVRLSQTRVRQSGCPGGATFGGDEAGGGCYETERGARSLDPIVPLNGPPPPAVAAAFEAS